METQTMDFAGKMRRSTARLAVIAMTIAGLSACSHHAPPRTAAPAITHSASSEAERPAGQTQTGVASFYGHGFAGRPTASGETFDPSAMTCAHRTLPFGTFLKVTNLANGKSVVVRVNDRGPYAKRRLIDLSEGAARKIGMIASGTAHVRVEVVTSTAER